jgi:hypothetical protein
MAAKSISIRSANKSGYGRKFYINEKIYKPVEASLTIQKTGLEICRFLPTSCNLHTNCFWIMTNPILDALVSRWRLYIFCYSDTFSVHKMIFFCRWMIITRMSAKMAESTNSKLGKSALSPGKRNCTELKS